MSTQFFLSNPTSQPWLHVGPLAGDLDGFATRLKAQGYARSSAVSKLRLVSNLSRWLEHRGLDVEALDQLCIEAFLLTRGPGYAQQGEAKTVRQLLDHLRAKGRLPPAPSPADNEGPFVRIERRYERFLVSERGLSRATVENYLPIIHTFLAERFATRTVALETLTVQDVNQFIVRQSQRLSSSSAKLLVTALRSFLRHLYQCTEIPVDLASALLPVVSWRLSGVPKPLAPEQVEAIIHSCDLSTAAGRRDRAILLLLARLGLRDGEVAAMALDDLDWDAGVVFASGKGQRREPLPLPREVGEALAVYLCAGRPRCFTRCVFVRLRAPHCGFAGPAAPGDMVRRARARAGIDPPRKGSHLLRHSLATAMLRYGASLEEIGQILRHRHPETTQIYAKVSNAAVWIMPSPRPEPLLALAAGRGMSA